MDNANKNWVDWSKRGFSDALYGSTFQKILCQKVPVQKTLEPKINSLTTKATQYFPTDYKCKPAIYNHTGLSA